MWGRGCPRPHFEAQPRHNHLAATQCANNSDTPLLTQPPGHCNIAMPYQPGRFCPGVCAVLPSPGWRVAGHNAEAATANRCGFQGPDTRQRLLPLLPFGPDGVGSAAAARPGPALYGKGAACQWPAATERGGTAWTGAAASCPWPGPKRAAALVSRRSIPSASRPAFCCRRRRSSRGS